VTGSGVVGRVSAGPTCPVERPDHPCPANPVHGQVVATDSSGQPAGSAATDDEGRFAIPVAPGDYTLRVSINGPLPRCPDTPVTVPAGSSVIVDIGCDTGIR
jgi:hypothetical protein